MAVQAICPECRAVYNLADEQEGKKVRCKHCQAVFIVGLTPPPRAQGPTTRVVERPQGRARPTQTMPARPTAARPAARRDEEDRASPRSTSPKREQGGRSSALPWIIGGGLGALAIVTGAVVLIVLVVLLKDKPAKVAATDSPAPVVQQQPPPVDPQPLPFKGPDNPPRDNQPVPVQPVVQPGDPNPAAPPADKPKPPADDPPRPAPADNGKISRGATDRVKRATVYLRVTMADGSKASGTGFFGSIEARNILLTNAHVVGMLAPESRRPRAIEVFVNSGQRDEWRTTARVLGVDRDSDLAVLDIGTPSRPTPEPLIVKSAEDLHELDEVYVFGFPFGEALGKDITIRPASVSALRKRGGRLNRVQVNGGMDPGNSGGPVVNNKGHVVGVAVSGIPGHQINFAIPGDRVKIILDGRISGLALHQPFFDPSNANRVGVPVVMQMLDPRNRIKTVALEVWTGNAPDKGAASRPATNTQPAPRPGDSPHQRFVLDYDNGEGKKEIILPELPAGKKWWMQPVWVDGSGQTRWASANVLRLPGLPVKREPANLVLRYPSGAARNLRLFVDNTLKVSADEDSDTFRMVTDVTFLEQVTSSSQTGAVLRLQYGSCKRDLIEPGSPPHPSKLLGLVKNDLPRVAAVLHVDHLGNLRKQDFLLPRGRLSSPPGALKDFHEPIQRALEAMSVSLPSTPNGMVQPGQSWKGTRPLPIDTPGKRENGWIDMTYTYQGVRKRDGRDEAVLAINGLVRGDRDKADAIGGTATGTVVIDLATGQTLLARTTVILDLQAVLQLKSGPTKPIKLLSTLQVRLERDLKRFAGAG